MNTNRHFFVARLVLLGSSFVFLSCLRNTAPPEYIKDVVAYKEGSDGIAVYFILADSRGEMTSATGQAEIEVSETVTSYSYYGGVKEREVELLTRVIPVRSQDFQNVKLGQGAFQRDAIVFVVGRITYGSFYGVPEENTGKVKLNFTTNDGRSMSGETTVFF
jgi:hypothetical protein